ncbi:hypothetical protein WSK_2304 [Novosphingobium sp. Rr 2-17]|uniref:hypothetical protein n=1 Tax=Novosphingobium sp. Rr 2-17 TaxID=555793 RepID=UPI0002699EC5|nr:hypothetical protein [Novosphingobium sp. Rr 2-17]EIZ79117.1 hypothetical protein WSK_2304 [Novosphingobium sp. Rr 2-17]
MTRAGFTKSKALVAGLMLAGLVSAGAHAQVPGPPAQGADGGEPPSPFPPPPPPTPAEKMVADLMPPGPGVVQPLAPYTPETPRPPQDPRNLRGTWVHNQPLEMRVQKDMYGTVLPYTMEGAKVLVRRVKALEMGKPFLNASARCRPPGSQWQRDLGMPFQVFQTDKVIDFVFEEYHGRWTIVLDPAAASKQSTTPYMGRSTGRWDGTTLVVETEGFRDPIYFDVNGTPLSTSAKLVDRIRKVDNGKNKPYLEIVTTVDDPMYYTAPWTIVRTYSWQPDFAVFKEYNCEEQLGDPDLNNNPNAGMVVEPRD